MQVKRGLAIVIAVSFVGCPFLKKKKAPEDDEVAPDAATVTVSGSGAKNEAAVLRYASETALPNVPAVIGAQGIAARTFPGSGPQVAFLAAGTPVAKIAQYFNTGVLVLFDDPSGDGTKLMGWVTPKAFDVAAPAPTKPVIVPPRGDAGGLAVKDSRTTVDAGATAKDAGAATVDAGHGGNAIVQPKKGQVSVPPVDGKCPDNWAVTDGMCRHKCSSDKDCDDFGLRNTKCKTSGSVKVCTSA